MSSLAMLTATLPQLKFLIEHGKTAAERDESMGHAGDAGGSWTSVLLQIHHRIKLFTVEKSWFLHFYAISVITCLFLLYIVYGGSEKDENKVTVLALFCLHSIRRLYECMYVFKFGSSRMHIAGYIAGVVYYVVVPVTLWHEACDGKFPLFEWRAIVGVLLFVCGNLAQSYFHWVLSAEQGVNHAGKKLYIFPRGLGFDFVSCPHYTAEMVLYGGLCLLVPGSVPMAALFSWVVLNLSVVAQRNHEWYWATFPEEMKRSGRARVLPLVW